MADDRRRFTRHITFSAWRTNIANLYRKGDDGDVFCMHIMHGNSLMEIFSKPFEAQRTGRACAFIYQMIIVPDEISAPSAFAQVAVLQIRVERKDGGFHSNEMHVKRKPL